MQVTRQKDGKTQYLYAVEVNELDGVAVYYYWCGEDGMSLEKLTKALEQDHAHVGTNYEGLAELAQSIYDGDGLYRVYAEEV
jgi:hypothetical protein